MFGDPNMFGGKGVGNPFNELIQLGRVPIFELGWQSPEAQNMYSQDVQNFIEALETTTQSKNLPWSSNIQICDEDKFSVMYNDFVKYNNPEDFHILCDFYPKITEYAFAVRKKPPFGLIPGDKVWCKEFGRIDQVLSVFPIHESGRGRDDPKNVCCLNKKNHSLWLKNMEFHSKD